MEAAGFRCVVVTVGVGVPALSGNQGEARPGLRRGTALGS